MGERDQRHAARQQPQDVPLAVRAGDSGNRAAATPALTPNRVHCAVCRLKTLVCNTHNMAALGQIQIQATWMLDPTSLPALANQLLIQPGLPADGRTSDGFYVYLGHISPPAFPTPAAAAAAATSPVSQPVVPVASVFVSRDRLRAFHRAIGEALEKDAAAPPIGSGDEGPQG